MAFLKIIAILLFLLGSALATPCQGPGSVSCCGGPKRLGCLFTKPEHSECSCHLSETVEGKDVVKECLWNTPYPGTELQCDMCGNTGTTRGSIMCPRGRYPIRVVDRGDDHPFCTMPELTEKTIYSMVIPCVLYDCEPRLRIPQITVQAHLENRERNLLCYPQILHAKSKLEYCELYATHLSVTLHKKDGTDYDIPDRKGFTQCVLPPICNAQGKIDRKEYMFPLRNKVNGAKEVADNYCEQLCPENENNGKNNTCRILPSCDPSDAYNYFKVPKCLPWCSNEDSYTRDSTKRSRICNPWPICNHNGTVDEPYSSTNPYGARENECMKMGECKGDWTEDTHFCTALPPPPTVEPPSGLLGNLETVLTGLIAYAVLASICLLIVCIAVGIIASKLLSKKTRVKPVDAEENGDKTKTIEEAQPRNAAFSITQQEPIKKI